MIGGTCGCSNSRCLAPVLVEASNSTLESYGRHQHNRGLLVLPDVQEELLMPREFRPDPLMWRCAHCKAVNRREPDEVAGGSIGCRECGRANQLLPIKD